MSKVISDITLTVYYCSILAPRHSFRRESQKLCLGENGDNIDQKCFTGLAKQQGDMSARGRVTAAVVYFSINEIPDFA